MAFPTSPTNGATHTDNSTEGWVSQNGVWIKQSSASAVSYYSVLGLASNASLPTTFSTFYIVNDLVTPQATYVWDQNASAYVVYNTTTVITAPTTFANSQAFNYTGALQNFTIPAAVIWMRLTMWGAGGSGDVGIAGSGGFTQVTLPVGTGIIAIGDVLQVIVGQGGLSSGNTSAYGFGGFDQSDGGGGGLSGVFKDALLATTGVVVDTDTAAALAVAGGGGGAGGFSAANQVNGGSGNDTTNGGGEGTMTGAADGNVDRQGSGGGGYAGGSLHTRSMIGTAAAGNGGTGFTHANGQNASIEFTTEFSQTTPQTGNALYPGGVGNGATPGQNGYVLIEYN